MTVTSTKYHHENTTANLATPVFFVKVTVMNIRHENKS
jgi:hypothetical protein